MYTSIGGLPNLANHCRMLAYTYEQAFYIDWLYQNFAFFLIQPIDVDGLDINQSQYNQDNFQISPINVEKNIKSDIQKQSINVECLYIPMSKHFISSQRYLIWDSLIQPITVEWYVKGFYSDWLYQDKNQLENITKNQYRMLSYTYAQVFYTD